MCVEQPIGRAGAAVDGPLQLGSAWRVRRLLTKGHLSRRRLQENRHFGCDARVVMLGHDLRVSVPVGNRLELDRLPVIARGKVIMMVQRDVERRAHRSRCRKRPHRADQSRSKPLSPRTLHDTMFPDGFAGRQERRPLPMCSLA